MYGVEKFQFRLRRKGGSVMRIERYGSRFWAVYEFDRLVCVTVYRKGALEVCRRLAGSVVAFDAMLQAAGVTV